MSKAARKGKSIELSGADPFNDLVLPLLKSLRFFKQSQTPPDSWVYFDLHFVLALAVLDAPMVGATILGGDKELRYTPWVRLYRHEASEEFGMYPQREGELFAVDVVHRDYLMVYLQDHAYPFAHTAAERAFAAADVLVAGEGQLSGIEEHGLEQLWTRLEAPDETF